MSNASEAAAGREPHLKVKRLSHGTVETRDIAKAKRFYEEMFGFEVRQTSAGSLMIRLNTVTTIACVETRGPTKAGLFSHFGLDFDTREEVDAAYQKVLGLQQEYAIKKVSKPVAQHGTYSFYIVDADENWWEVLTNPEGGYSYVFDLSDEEKSFREMRQAGDRQERWQQQKSPAE